LAATVGYLVGTVGPVALSLVLIERSVDEACTPEVAECYAGLAYLLVVPVALAAALVIGPAGCLTALALRGHRRAGATGWRCAALAVLFPAAVVLADMVASAVPSPWEALLEGLDLASLGLVLVVPVAARAWALAGHPPEGVREETRRATTWESSPPPGS
jgi:hypothetical protein